MTTPSLLHQAASRLYAIVDVDTAGRARWATRDLARAYLAGGARRLQLRDKRDPSGAFLELAAAIVEDAAAAGATLIVNDRVDIAAIARAAGVHVGQDDLAPADVRRVVGADSIVGFSTHTPDQIADALEQPISYLAIGPVFQTGGKDTGYAPVGHVLVQHAATRAAARGLPVVAIGGITLDTAPGVVEAGASAVAIISDLLQGDPERRVAQYLAALA